MISLVVRAQTRSQVFKQVAQTKLSAHMTLSMAVQA
jgi:hypothetical protein